MKSKHPYRWLVLLPLLWLFAAAPAGEGEWTTEPSMPTPRTGLSAAVLDGQVYVLGGRGADGAALDVVEAYDPFERAWETGLPSLPAPRFNAAAAVLDGRLYLVGGRDDGGQVLRTVVTYDPTSNRWDEGADLTTAREGLTVVATGGRLYALGGSNQQGAILSSVEVYDPGEDRWEVVSGWQLGLPRAAFASVVLDGRVVSIGGFTPLGPVGDVEAFDVAAGVPGALPGLSPSRGGLAAVVSGDTIFAIGGRGGGDRVLDEVAMLLPASEEWIEQPRLITPREHFAAVAVEGTLYVFGGRDERGDVLASVEAYDPIQVPTVGADQPELPDALSLEAAYPNPFAGSAQIAFHLAEAGPVRLTVYDVQGREVAVLVDAVLPPGRHVAAWDGTRAGLPAASGLYLCRLEQGARHAVRTLILAR